MDAYNELSDANSNEIGKRADLALKKLDKSYCIKNLITHILNSSSDIIYNNFYVPLSSKPVNRMRWALRKKIAKCHQSHVRMPLLQGKYNWQTKRDMRNALQGR